MHDAQTFAGLLLVFADGARLDEWRPNRTEEVESFELGEPMADSHELRGPAASHPKGSGEGAPGNRSSSQRDLFERRLEQHRVAFIRKAADRCAGECRRRRWPLVLVLGEPHLAGPAAEVLRKGGIEVVVSDRLLSWMAPSELAKAVGPMVEQALVGRGGGLVRAP